MGYTFILLATSLVPDQALFLQANYFRGARGLFSEAEQIVTRLRNLPIANPMYIPEASRPEAPDEKASLRNRRDSRSPEPLQ